MISEVSITHVSTRITFKMKNYRPAMVLHAYNSIIWVAKVGGL
jgi:hypothetical protein